MQRKPTNSDPAASLVTVKDPTGIASEAYRTLRTNLFYALTGHPPSVIVLTSPGPKEGKSTTCANLGVVLAQAGKRTLIMDCNFRKPVLHEIFGLPNSSGLVNILTGEHNSQGAVLEEPFPNLKVATPGRIPHNPTELLSSGSFAQFVDQARQGFDYVLIDSPHLLMDSYPIGPSADPVILATQADGVLLVLDAHSTREEPLREAVRALKSVRANIIGAVVNNAEDDRRR
jgi:capsular exopolysaccharide synthesis family protein